MSRQLITPKLMRGLGYEIKSVGDNGPSTPKEYRNRYEKWVHRDKWNKCDQHCGAIFFDRTTGEWRRDGKEIVYIVQIA